MPEEYPMTDRMREQLESSFTYHPPKDNQPERYILLRSSARQLAEQIVYCTPPSRYQSLAITKLEEAIMWANKAIACEE